jgi:hypothetical protein
VINVSRNLLEPRLRAWNVVEKSQVPTGIMNNASIYNHHNMSLLTLYCKLFIVSLEVQQVMSPNRAYHVMAMVASENTTKKRHNIEKLNKFNYGTWKVKMQLVLEDLELWDVPAEFKAGVQEIGKETEVLDTGISKSWTQFMERDYVCGGR